MLRSVTRVGPGTLSVDWANLNEIRRQTQVVAATISVHIDNQAVDLSGATVSIVAVVPGLTFPILLGTATNAQLILVDDSTSGAITLCTRIIPRGTANAHAVVTANVQGVEALADIELAIDYHLEPYVDDIGVVS